MVTERFVLRRLAFTGPRVERRELSFVDGVNVVWGASNAGKTYTLRMLDFMLGAKDPPPGIPQLDGFATCWLELDLPQSGTVTLSRSFKAGAIKLFLRSMDEAWASEHDRVLPAKHAAATESLSSFLLGELGIDAVRLSSNAQGKPQTFTFRNLAPYVLTHETPMMGEASPVSVTAFVGWTFDRNVLRYLLTGVDDSDVVEAVKPTVQKTANLGKIEILDEMIAVAAAELVRLFPDDPDPTALDLEGQADRLATEIRDHQSSFVRVQSELDTLRRERRSAVASRDEAAAAASELAATLQRFDLLNAVYRSDIARLAALEEGAAALLAGSRRACPTCGADPDHQRMSHGLEHVDITKAAVGAEIAKIHRERAELASTVRSVDAERVGLLQRAVAEDRVVDDTDRRIEATLPVEAASRQTYEMLDAARHRIREGLAIKGRIESFKSRRTTLQAFKARKPSGDPLAVGVDGVLGESFAKVVEGVLHAWQFPGSPRVTWNETKQDIRIDGRDRDGNGKGVRSLMHAAFKIALRIHCRDNGLPHPGVLVLDSPLVSYRDPKTTRHGELSADEEEVKSSGLNTHFYKYLLEQSRDTQFIVLENDAPPFNLGGTASVTEFVGRNGIGDRQGLF